MKTAASWGLRVAGNARAAAGGLRWPICSNWYPYSSLRTGRRNSAPQKSRPVYDSAAVAVAAVVAVVAAVVAAAAAVFAVVAAVVAAAAAVFAVVVVVAVC